MKMGWRGVVACAVTFGLAGCESSVQGPLPSAEQVGSSYQYAGGVRAEIVGNVAVVLVPQSAQQLRRGGKLWAKVGPYIFLFSEETRLLFEEYAGLAAVRVITTVGDAEVANAMLLADELPDIRWRRSLNISGQARRDGTERITLL